MGKYFNDFDTVLDFIRKIWATFERNPLVFWQVLIFCAWDQKKKLDHLGILYYISWQSKFPSHILWFNNHMFVWLLSCQGLSSVRMEAKFEWICLFGLKGWNINLHLIQVFLTLKATISVSCLKIFIWLKSLFFIV